MNRIVTLVLLTLLPVPGPLAAQDPAPTTRPMSEAEQAFRDGWWAENGRSDLATALQRYLAAAAAPGAVALRAKALLHAGAVQQRLGKTESAIATFRQLLAQHADQTDVAEQARVYLRELTAADLRQNYDEWYERRLFSEEVQLRILERIEALARALAESAGDDARRRAREQTLKTLEVELRGFGKGAVPALRKASESPDAALAEHATQLLFALQVVPPQAALLRCHQWLDDAASWELLLGAGTAGFDRVPGRGAQVELMRLVWRGRDALVKALLSDQPPALLAAESEPLIALAMALLRTGERGAADLLAAAFAPAVSLRVRRGFEQAVCRMEEPPALRAGDWLRLGGDALLQELRLRSLQCAAQALRAEDGAVLDQLLARLAAAPRPGSEAGMSLCQGLAAHASPLHVPWTAARLDQLLRVAGGWNVDGVLSGVIGPLRQSATTRAVVVEALFLDPVALRAAFPLTREPGQPPLDPLAGQLVADTDSDASAALLRSQWHAAVAGHLTGAWPGWDDARRVAALQLLPAVASLAAGETAALDAFLRGVESGASPAVRAALAELRAGGPR